MTIIKILSCDMDRECKAPVTHIDEKGFVYCTECGNRRKLYRRCRKLKPSELKQIMSGQPLARY